MRKIGILVISAILALVLFNCEKPEDEIDSINEPDKVAISRERISFLKSSNIAVDDYKNQQDFTLYSVTQADDTTFVFVVEYLVSDINKPHEFDFVWDEKLDADDEGKIWMNLDMYHKTVEETADITFVDSTFINISALTKVDKEILSELWLRFDNTTKEDNSFVVKYLEDINTSSGENNSNNGESTVQDSTQTGGTTQDSTGTQTEGTTQDSTGYETGDTTGTETGETVQDSTNTETGGTTQDSTGYETGGTTETETGETTQDSTGYETGGTVQDSTGYETGGTTETETGGTVQDSTGYETGGTTQDSTTYSGN